ncbi:MAG TPA: exodeoxyribonuclease VII large subunit [Deltaproteobacteria bacterium]|nr:exodeoxyribonuclease VII large subunit [Deltaproteobacteria bacterium]
MEPSGSPLQNLHGAPARRDGIRILRVSELTANIKALVETGFGIIWVEGEVSNFRCPASGHLYFTLKDESSQIRAVMFRQNAAAAGFRIEDGHVLVCRGRLTVYTPRGDCQLVVEAVEPRGIGALQIAFEQLKSRLEAEGLFDGDHKRPLPLMPSRIGIITSSTGAAVRDILTVMKRRFPACSVLIAPVRVQGNEAAAEIREALSLLNTRNDIDVIIIARGGGSLEDLQPFNDESLARAVYGSKIPVVSAVGHEIDFTITDFVADLRAPTPSAAAELVVPDRRELADVVKTILSRIVSLHSSCCRELRRCVKSSRERLGDPRGRINDLRIYLDDRTYRLSNGARRVIDSGRVKTVSSAGSCRRLSPLNAVREYRKAVDYLRSKAILHGGYLRGRVRARVERATAVLETMSPASVLARGYSITRRLSDEALITGAEELEEGNDVSVELDRGAFHAKVIQIIQGVPHGGRKI